jgi:hypothetical protein
MHPALRCGSGGVCWRRLRQKLRIDAFRESAPERTATSLNPLPNLPKPEKEFSKALIPGKTIIGTMRGRMLVCIVLGLLAVTPALAPASERAGETVMGTPAGWSDEINLSNNSLPDVQCWVECEGENVYAIWGHVYVLNYDNQIVYTKSTDSGRTWSNFKNVSNSDYIAWDSHLAVSDQYVNVVWSNFTDTDGLERIYFSNSNDRANTWSNEKQISKETGYKAVGPEVFANNSNVHIIWKDMRGSDEEIYYRRSVDGGITFDNGQGVDEDRRITFSPSAISGQTITGSGSNISVAWADERLGGNYWEIYWMISKDNGYTWEDGLGNVGQDRRISFVGAQDPAIAMVGSTIHMVYVDPIDVTNDNLFYINSTDNGATWNTPIKLIGPTPHVIHPNIDVDGDNVCVVWSDRRDDGTHGQIYYKKSSDGGITWSGDLRLTYNLSLNSQWPRLSIFNNTIHLVWCDILPSNDREVMYKRSPDFPTPTYTIPLSQGWNLLSTPLIPSDGSINKVLENITGKWDYIQLYNSTDSDHWKSNMTYRPDQLNDLNSLDYSMGFWINITEPGVFLTLKGQIPNNTVIPLYAGWNLVGYPTLNDTMTVGNALWGTGADRVEVCDALAPYRLREVGSTYIMKPGEGYWVHVPADATWVVDW